MDPSPMLMRLPQSSTQKRRSCENSDENDPNQVIITERPVFVSLMKPLWIGHVSQRQHFFIKFALYSIRTQRLNRCDVYMNADMKIRYYSNKPDHFLDTLRERIERYSTAPETMRHAHYVMIAKILIYSAGAISSYVFLLTSARVDIALGSAVAFGLFCLFLALNVGHDAAHDSLTGHRRIDRAALVIVFAILGVDGPAWRLRHTTQHHPYPNIDGADSDIERNPLLRLSPVQPFRHRHRYQPFYAPFVYCILLVHTVLWQDFISFFHAQRLAHRRERGFFRYAQFFLCKAFYLTMIFVIPPAVTHLSTLQVAVGYLAMSFAASLLFVFLLVGTHLSSQTLFPQPDADGTLGHSWALHALKTTVDWSPRSYAAGFLTGGTNTHVIHHLFPRLPSTYYRGATLILEQTSREFSLPYHSTNFTGILTGHLHFLRQMAKRSTV